jgi:hypothetical protein
MWTDNFPRCRNLLSQIVHWKGFSPVCVIRCSIRYCSRVNSLSQTSHSNFLRPRWCTDFIWRPRENCVVNVLLHLFISHLRTAFRFWFAVFFSSIPNFTSSFGLGFLPRFFGTTYTFSTGGDVLIELVLCSSPIGYASSGNFILGIFLSMKAFILSLTP